MDHKQLLKDLGGEHAVHAALASEGFPLKPVTVRAWALGERAIPAKYWAHIKRLADQRDVAVTFAQLAESVKAEPPALSDTHKGEAAA